jgi:iron complex outermembrane receptor protein
MMQRWLLFFWLAGGLVHGQSPPLVTNLVDMELEQVLQTKADQVYGASRRWQSVDLAPASVTLISSEEIRQFGYRTLAEALNRAPGLYVTSDRSYNYLGIRGFNRPGDYNSRFLLMVDGHRLNDNVYDAAPVGNEFPLDLDLVDRIEIIRGPGSALYGNNAFFGVINVVTKRGRDINRVEAAGSIGSNLAGQGRFTYGQVFTNGVEWLVSGTYEEDGGPSRLDFVDATGAPWRAHNQAYRSGRQMFTTLKWKEVTLSGMFSEKNNGLPTASYGADQNSAENRFRDTWGYLDLKWNHTWDEHQELIGRVNYNSYQYEGFYAYGGLVNVDDVVGESWGTDWQYNQQLWDEHTLTLGTEFRQNIRQDQANFNQGVWPKVLDDQRHSFNWAAFAQMEWLLCSNVVLNAGGRLDYHDQFGSELNPRLALIWQPGGHTTLKGIYGRSYRAPNVYERFYTDTTTYGANPALVPEYIRTYEVVLQQRLANGLTLGLNAYYYDVDRLISALFDAGTGLIAFQNVDSVNARGVEPFLEYEHEKGLRLRVGHSLQRARGAGGGLANSPTHLTKINLTVPIVSDRLLTSIEGLYSSAADGVAPGLRAADYFLVNLTLFSRPLRKNMDVAASIYNVFGEKYAFPAASELFANSGPLMEMDGRSFRVKMTLRF